MGEVGVFVGHIRTGLHKSGLHTSGLDKSVYWFVGYWFGIGFLQTNAMICWALLHRMYPGQYSSPNRLLCGNPATLAHSMWACPQEPFPYGNSDE